MRIQQAEVVLAILISSSIVSFGGHTLAAPMKNKTTSGVTLKVESEAAYYSIAFSPEGDEVACVDWKGTVLIWSAATGKEVKILKPVADDPDPQLLGAMAFSPNGKTIASARAGTIVLWDRETGQQRSLLEFPGTQQVSSVSFSSDDKCLAAGTINGAVHLWDLATGQLRASLPGHEVGVYMAAFSPDAKILAIPDEQEGHVSLWDVATGRRRKVLKVLDNIVGAISFSQDGKTLKCSSGAKIVFFDLASGKKKSEINVPIYSPHAIAFSADGSSLAVGGGDMDDLSGNDRERMFAVRIMDVKTGQTLQRLIHHTQGVTSVAYSRDGKRVASTSYDGTVRLWTLAK